MKQLNQIKILAIESSCDETAAAVIGEKDGEPLILSSVISSQIDLHAKTGGVVPEVASRAHLDAIIPVIEEALSESSQFKIQNSKFNLNSKFKNLNLSDVTHIAVTAGPGLIGSLLVGFNTAKALAYARDLPIIPINHIEGHIYSALAQNRISNNQDTIRQLADKQIPNSKSSSFKSSSSWPLEASSFPLLALTVSGGHTSLTLMHSHGVFENIGATLDDAAGEAFDKVAKLLDLGYPGGPAVSKCAAEYREKMTGSKCNIPGSSKLGANSLKFPRPLLDQDNFNFSFSGLKTAVLYAVQKLTANGYQLTALDKQQISYEFEEAAVEVLVTKTLRAAAKYGTQKVILAGGVAANKRLRDALSHRLSEKGIELMMPPLEFTGDNAAMIGIAAYYHILRGETQGWNDIEVDSNIKI